LTDLRVFVFADPGVDDILAILALLGAGARVVGFCGSGGNVGSRAAADNISWFLRSFGRSEVPIFKGADRPAGELAGTPISPHGLHGIGDLRPDESTGNYPPLGDCLPLLARDQDVHLLCLSPLTDIAQALQRVPELKNGRASFVLMGGAARRGNVTPHSEFNIRFDAAAAKAVLESGWTMQIVPLDITERLRIVPEDLQHLCPSGSVGHTWMSQLLGPYFDFHEANEGFRGCYVHDPSAVAALLWPELFKFRGVSVTVDERPGPTHGMTLFDFRERSLASGVGNVQLAIDLDEVEVKQRLLRCIREMLKQLKLSKV
jgi:purine nucleosidase